MELKEYITEEIEPCKKCPMSDSGCRKAYDRWIPEEPVPIVICSEGPGYTEDRCGTPFVGAAEIMSSVCGMCIYLKKCFSWFLGLSRSYKGKEFKCRWPEATIETLPESATPDLIENRYLYLESMISNSNGRHAPRTAGQLLNELLKSVGLYRKSMIDFMREPDTEVKPTVYTTNVVLCRPFILEDGKKNNREPFPLEIGNCSYHIKAIIEAVKPKVIIAPGRIAINTLTKLDEPVQQALKMATDGTLPSPIFKDIPIIPTYHPSYLSKLLGKNSNRFNSEKSRFITSLELAKRIADS